jgi:hypothetical protein
MIRYTLICDNAHEFESWRGEPFSRVGEGQG